MTALPAHEPVPEIEALGFRAFTTTRDAGTYGLSGTDPVGDVMERWAALASAVVPETLRVASLRQVHGARVVEHRDPWPGWLRVPDADGHVSSLPDTAVAVGIADCMPIFIAHPSGAFALLHSGWRGTAAGIFDHGLGMLTSAGLAAADVTVHLGPAICGRCYEVGPDVHARLTGTTPAGPKPIDLRAIVADQARRAGVRRVSISTACTRCDNDRFFSHRAGDAGRQIAVIARTR